MNNALPTSLLLLALGAELVVIASISPAAAQGSPVPAPKRVLVVSTTVGFRHSSIPTAENVLGDLARQTREFTVEYARVDPSEARFQGADGKPDKAKVHEAIRVVLAEKMSSAALKNYDAVVFANTTGDLPLPDSQAFLDWIRSGKGFVGMHAATDTFPGLPAYTEMIGGHFLKHGPQVEVDIINQDSECSACRHLGATWKVYDEIYQFKDFDRSKVHGLLTLDEHPNDKTPGDYPVAWRKDYGNGRVFYTSLGHREDIWDPAWVDKNGERKNSPEVSRQYQQHILGGIRWALGIDSARPE
jgi:type 1 glutamine amidotransferase